VARSIHRPEAALRAYLLEETQAFRRLMVDTLLGDSIESAQIAWTECSKPVDALAAGEAVRIHRFALPPDHPLAPPHGGRPCDDLELGADNVLRAVTTKHVGPQGF